MEVSEPMILKTFGCALGVVTITIALYEYLPSFLARRRQRKMDGWRYQLVDVTEQIAEIDQKIKEYSALDNERRFQKAWSSLQESAGFGYIARHGRAGSGINTPQLGDTHPDPILSPEDKDRLAKLLQRRKSLERRLGIRRS